MARRALQGVLGAVFICTLIACGGDIPPPEPPPPIPPDVPAAPSAPVATEPPAATSATPTAAVAEPPPPAAAPATPVKDVLGKVSAIEVREVDFSKGADATTSVRSYKKAPDIDAILKAIGTDQKATGPKRKCPDSVQVSFVDETGAEKGVLGLCGGLGAKDPPLEGAEFGKTKNERAGLQLADADALKKALTKAPGTKQVAPKPAAPPATTSAPKSPPAPAPTSAPKAPVPPTPPKK